ncbi:MAG: 30S ribosomal protein S20 [Pirellulales bacterium]|nr:30S ribosomal protein S20 [Pirellulales bacterium]
MPNIKSAAKRLRQNIRRRTANRAVKSTLRTQNRKVAEAIEAGNVEQAETELRQAAKLLDRAGARRVIHPNTAARKKSRLSKKIKALKQKAAP